MMAQRLVKPDQRGFTLIELLVVLVIATVVLGLGVPSFVDYLARKRVEGVFNELQTDLQFARTEAVSRNLPVRLTFGPACYVVHTHPAGAGPSSCTQTSDPTIGTGAAQLKLVQLQPGSTAVLSPNDTLTRVEFEPLRGGASWDGSGAVASVNVNANPGAWQMRLSLSGVGRVGACSPSGSVQGYVPCP